MTGSNNKRPTGRPKQTVTEAIDLKNLHVEWDSIEEIRDRIREGGDLLIPSKGESIPAILSNSSVLQPLITRMSLTQTKPLPIVEPLRDEVEAIFIKNKRAENRESVPDVVAASWKIRKLLTFLKMKVRRKEVSSASWLLIKTHVLVHLYVINF